MKAVHPAPAAPEEKKRRRKSKKNVGDAELESLAGDSGGEEPSASLLPYDPSEEAKAAAKASSGKPPRPSGATKDSAHSYYSSNPGTDRESEEEEAAREPGGGSKRASPHRLASAKSRDSGYLGESQNREAAVWREGAPGLPSDGSVSVSEVRPHAPPSAI